MTLMGSRPLCPSPFQTPLAVTLSPWPAWTSDGLPLSPPGQGMSTFRNSMKCKGSRKDTSWRHSYSLCTKGALGDKCLPSSPSIMRVPHLILTQNLLDLECYSLFIDAATQLLQKRNCHWHLFSMKEICDI